jgi:hypothetical protein
MVAAPLLPFSSNEMATQVHFLKKTWLKSLKIAAYWSDMATQAIQWGSPLFVTIQAFPHGPSPLWPDNIRQGDHSMTSFTGDPHSEMPFVAEVNC